MSKIIEAGQYIGDWFKSFRGPVFAKVQYEPVDQETWVREELQITVLQLAEEALTAVTKSKQEELDFLYRHAAVLAQASNRLHSQRSSSKFNCTRNEKAGNKIRSALELDHPPGGNILTPVLFCIKLKIYTIFMPTNRKLVFANNEIYHVFNRGVEKRPTFTDKRELNRAVFTLDYYRYDELPLKLSKFLVAPEILKEQLLENIKKDYEKLVEIICFCFMPNHFHLLLKQKMENGISTFVSNITNSYTRYFNTKHERIGPLFEGIFKAVRIVSDEQLVHVSRYIHLNPVSSYLIEPTELEDYGWSSYPEYLGLSDRAFITKDLILSFFRSVEEYKKFVLDQVDYARQLEAIKHLSFE